MENELTHWGTKGMRWGIRRYQNRDGTLTPAGRKRYAKEMEKLKAEEKILRNRQKTQSQFDKLEAKRKEIEALKSGKSISKSTSKESGKTSVKDMSDDELRTVVNRLMLEQQYRRLKPEQVSAGKKFVDSVMKNVVAPAATEVGKNVLKNAMTNAITKATSEKDKKS